jgi:hypothetical protein
MRFPCLEAAINALAAATRELLTPRVEAIETITATAPAPKKSAAGKTAPEPRKITGCRADGPAKSKRH